MKRITVILVAILIVQVLIWALTSIDRHVVSEKKNFLSSDTSGINFIHIKNEDGEVTLKRVGGLWKVSEPYDYTANPSYIQTMLKKLAGLKYESHISNNEEKFESYEVAGEKAAYVEVGVEGGVMDKFYCGKPSKNYTHTYMRLADKNEIWLISGTPRSSFTRKPNDWRDKKIMRLDKTMMERILLKFPDETVELKREIASTLMDTTLIAPDTSWIVIPQKGKSFKPVDKVLNRVKNTLSKMNATDFKIAGTDEMPGFEKPILTVEVFLEGDQHEVLDFVSNPDDDMKYLVRKNGSEETIFIVYKSSYSNLSKRADDFREVDKEK
ncbi:MAG: DUF4340 domain-containing protein [Calditrichaeota bacterium]|nr:DUF4340 domain-containing protein [Calditrichota bacterium]